MERRSKVIWTCGPSGGATVKHLTIKQLNCALPASLSGKLIQRIAWMILSIRGEEKKPHGQSECLHSNKATLRSHRRWSNHQRENKPNARTGNKKMSLFAHISCSVIVQCRALTLVSDGATFPFCYRRRKHVDLWDQAFLFSYTSCYYSCDLNSPAKRFKRPQLIWHKCARPRPDLVWRQCTTAVTDRGDRGDRGDLSSDWLMGQTKSRSPGRKEVYLRCKGTHAENKHLYNFISMGFFDFYERFIQDSYTTS